jgi:ligand-binding SRPBCC domain-containing protein
MREGLEIEYRLRLYGLPIRWRSRIDVWEPPRRFVDRQIAGPFVSMLKEVFRRADPDEKSSGK